MGVPTSPLPAVGVDARSISDQKVYNALLEMQNVLTGGIDLSNAASALTTDYGYAFSTYKLATLIPANILSAGAVSSATTFFLNNVSGIGIVPTTSNLGYIAPFYLDPADYSAGSRTTKYRLDVSFITNGVAATGRTSTFGLYPVSSVSGGVVTLGTVTSGSTVAIANPAINTLTHQNSGDFVAPAAGMYALGFASSGAYTASSDPGVTVRLLARQV